MKKIITYFFLGCFSYVVSSCSDLAFGDSFLEKAPGEDVTVDTIFSSKLYADRALNISRPAISWDGTIWMH